MIQSWGVITIEALQSVWKGILMFLPKLIGAIIVFVIGWFVALGVGRLITEILKRIKLDRFFEKAGWKEALEKAEIKVTVSGFIGEICKWILVIVFLLAAVEILGLEEFAEFLRQIILWLPNLIVAVAIFIVAVIVAELLEKIIKASVKKMEISYVGFFGGLVKWAIYIFAGLAILYQLGVAKEIVNALIFGIIATLSLALGLAFGLGGKDAAAKLIEEIKKKISEK
jgi:small-conductance mechanosensitive channel